MSVVQKSYKCISYTGKNSHNMITIWTPISHKNPFLYKQKSSRLILVVFRNINHKVTSNRIT